MDGCEWTVEVAHPKSATKSLMFLPKGSHAHIPRRSNLFPGDDEVLGRHHKVEKVFSAYSMIREKAVFRVNLDLLFGAPGQTLDMWELT